MQRRYKARQFIAYFQAATNTHAPVEKLRRLYDEALDHPQVVGLAIGTRPDSVPDAVLDLSDDETVDALLNRRAELKQIEVRGEAARSERREIDGRIIVWLGNHVVALATGSRVITVEHVSRGPYKVGPTAWTVVHVEHNKKAR